MFCINCGTKAAEGDKFCLKCGKPIVAPPDAAVPSAATPDAAPGRSAAPNAAPPSTSKSDLYPPYAPPDAAPAYAAPPKTADPYAPPDAAPAYAAPPYPPAQPVAQSTKPFSGRKVKLTPVLIAAAAVVVVALIAVVLFFVFGTGSKDQSDNESIGNSLSDTEETDSSTDDDMESVADPEPDPEPEDSPPPEEDEEEEEEAEEDEAGNFILIEDGTGFIFNGVEFQLNDVDLNPIFAPADMQDGHVPFMVNFIMTNHPDEDEVMSLLYKVGYFMVGDEKAEFGAALLGDENINQSIYSLVSSCTKIDVNSPITLYLGDNAFIIR